MGKLKLTYFNGRGRGEPARLILAQAGVEYEDERIEFEDWPAFKPSKMFCILLVWRLLELVFYLEYKPTFYLQL